MNLLGPTSISAIYTADGKKRFKKESLARYTVIYYYYYCYYHNNMGRASPNELITLNDCYLGYTVSSSLGISCHDKQSLHMT